MHDRPLGIKILCALQLLGTAFTMCQFCVLGKRFLEVGVQAAGVSHISPRAYVAILMVCAYLYLFATFGMYTGRAWGWWLGTFTYGLVATGAALSLALQILLRPEHLPPPAADPRAAQGWVIIQMLVSGLILAYLHSDPVRDFFKLADRPLWLDLAILIVSVTAATFGIAMVLRLAV